MFDNNGLLDDDSFSDDFKSEENVFYVEVFVDVSGVDFM
jgi:hypothetical protein